MPRKNIKNRSENGKKNGTKKNPVKRKRPTSAKKKHADEPRQIDLNTYIPPDSLRLFNEVLDADRDRREETLDAGTARQVKAASRANREMIIKVGLALAAIAVLACIGYCVWTLIVRCDHPEECKWALAFLMSIASGLAGHLYSSGPGGGGAHAVVAT